MVVTRFDALQCNCKRERKTNSDKCKIMLYYNCVDSKIYYHSFGFYFHFKKNKNGKRILISLHFNQIGFTFVKSIELKSSFQLSAECILIISFDLVFFFLQAEILYMRSQPVVVTIYSLSIRIEAL